MEELNVAVDGTTITVTMRGTSLRTSFFKNPEAPGVLQRLSASRDSEADISIRDFETLAWEAANAKARELGWL
jgi:hypothetical protein